MGAPKLRFLEGIFHYEVSCFEHALVPSRIVYFQRQRMAERHLSECLERATEDEDACVR